MDASDSDAYWTQQVLNHIASGETSATPGEGYNELYGGGRFNSLAGHPNVHIPTGDGGFTSAAGRYQFESGTWADEAKKLGLTDFSPASQDAAAWDLANTTYAGKTGRSLLADAKSGNVDWGALSGQWTSLGKGTGEQGANNGSGGASVAAAPTALPPSVAAPQFNALLMLQSLAPHLEFTPVDYDPFAVEKTGETT